MDTNKLIDRVRKILLAPKAEWQVVATESTSVSELYKSYIFILAAIPAVMQFIKLSIIGTDILFAGRVRLGIMSGLTTTILGYAMTLATVYVMALVVEALAPHFNGEKNRLQALKLVTYAFTASWVAQIGLLVPGLWMLIGIAGVVYTIYLLYLGLPVTMKCPQEKTAGYVVATLVIGIVLSFVGNAAVNSTINFGSYGSAFGSNDSRVKLDEDSALGQLQSYAASVAKTAQRFAVIPTSHAANAEQDVPASTVRATPNGRQPNALPPEQLKSFIPDTLGGRPRTKIGAAYNPVMQSSAAEALFQSESGRFRLLITDVGEYQSLRTASRIVVEDERRTKSTYEKTYREKDRLVTVQWLHRPQ